MTTNDGVAQLTPADISARLDRIPKLTRRHYGVIILLVALFMFDLMDITSLSLVAPAIREEWGLSVEQLGLLVSTTFVGMFLGGLLGGRLSDRFGRKPILLIGVLLFSLASIAGAFAPNAEILGAFRFVLGFGLQMTTSAVLVMVSETFPKAIRGRVMAIVLGVSLIAPPLIALVALLVVPMGLWHAVFLVGGLGIIPGLIALKYLPESPRWLAARGRFRAAEEQIRIYETQYTVKHGTLPAPIPPANSAQPPSSGKTLDIFKRNLIGRTIIATLLFCGFILINYGFAQWLPVILVERGYAQSAALTLTFVLSFAYMAGAFLAALIVDRVERKFVIAIAIAVTAICYLVIGFVDSVAALLVAGFVANMLLQGVLAALYSYVPELFPVQIRGTGAGFANGMSRFAGMFSGVIIAAVLTVYAVTGVFVYLAIVAIAMAAVALYGPRTRARRPRRTPDESEGSVAAGANLEG